MNNQRKLNINKDNKRIYDMLCIVRDLENTVNHFDDKSVPPTEYAFVCGQIASIRMLLKKHYNINPDTVNLEDYNIETNNIK